MKVKLTNFKPNNEGIFIHKNVEYIDYLDGSENMLADILNYTEDISYDSDTLSNKVTNWPLQYHFGKGRANIIIALNLPKNTDVLEIGAGGGAITRYLGENFEEVWAVEGNIKRAKIAKQRCRDLKNVKIFAGNVEQIEFDKKFDLVLLIGVLEYSPKYFKILNNKLEALEKMLKIAKAALKENGILIIAIENKIGLKYWNGSPEDHTGGVFDGIHGYIDKDVITLSKNEYENLLNRVGLKFKKFFYIFPDYKFAETIINEDLKNEEESFLYNWIKFPFPPRGTKRNYFFHEGLAIRTLAKANLLKWFSNSFLILASKKPLNFNVGWHVKKFSTNRKKCFETLTQLVILDNEEFVVKKKLFDQVECHKDFIEHTIEARRNYIKGELLSWRFHEALFKKNPILNLVNLTNRLYHFIMQNFSVNKTDKDNIPIVKGLALDAIPRNIVINKNTGKWHTIDLEWNIGIIPIDFVIYRAIFNDFVIPNLPFLKNSEIITPVLLKSVRLWKDEHRLKTLKDLETRIQKAILHVTY